MIGRLSHACVFVLDQDRAKEFYTKKLGFEVRHDVRMGTDFEGAGERFRWLTVSPPEQPDVEIILPIRGWATTPRAPSRSARSSRRGRWAPGR